MEDIHQLTLIFMETLYLYIKDGAGIHINAVILLDVFCQAELVLVLNVHKLLLAFLVGSVNLQLLDMGQISNPLIPYLGRYPVSQQRVPMKEETPLGNAVGLIVKLLRIHLVEGL